MFIVIGYMLLGITVGYLLRRFKIRFAHTLIVTFIWLLLFLLGLEVGTNQTVVSQIGKLGFEAALIAISGTLGSIIAAKLLWNNIKKHEL